MRQCTGNQPRSLAFVPDFFKTEEMCNQAVEKDTNTLWHVPVPVPVHIKNVGQCFVDINVSKAVS